MNNAAFEATFGGLETTPESDFEKAIQTNLLSTLGLTREALPHLKASRGAIVFVGSQTMFKPPPESMQIAYAASKGALLGASRHLAIEVGSHGVRVNTVAPGWMWGPPVEFFVNYTAEQQKQTPEDVIAHLTAPMAMDFFATDGDVAEVIGFFASSRAKGVTGQTIMVNAGENHDLCHALRPGVTGPRSERWTQPEPVLSLTHAPVSGGCRVVAPANPAAELPCWRLLEDP